jgi:protein-disulfide isomerase
MKRSLVSQALIVDGIYAVNRAYQIQSVMRFTFASAFVLLITIFAVRGAGAAEIDLGQLPHPSSGPENASVTMIEFSDFECPNCRRLEPELEQLRRIYASKMRFVWIDFPLDAHHHAMLAAEAARCAGEQDQFWPYHDALMSGRESLGAPNLVDLAARLGLDSTKFNSCLAARKYQGLVESDMDRGDRLGVSGTPTIFINGQIYMGGQSLDDLKAAIDSAAKEASAGPSVEQPSRTARGDQQ